MALGAHRGAVMGMVLAEGPRMALAGIAVGIATAIALTRSLASRRFGVTQHDPLTFAVVAAVLIIVALLAGYLPARRAMRIDPVIALRDE